MSSREIISFAAFEFYVLIKKIFPLLFLSILCAEAPWGKDADLALSSDVVSSCRANCVVEGLISFHQNVVSPVPGPQSHHRPSSSQYMLDAVRRYGFFEGFALGCDRLLRENQDPWIYSRVPDGTGATLKWDPVP